MDENSKLFNEVKYRTGILKNVAINEKTILRKHRLRLKTKPEVFNANILNENEIKESFIHKSL